MNKANEEKKIGFQLGIQRKCTKLLIESVGKVVHSAEKRGKNGGGGQKDFQ